MTHFHLLNIESNLFFLNFRIPFTIQRLCELLTEPKRNYTGTDKFLRGVEKVSPKHYFFFIIIFVIFMKLLTSCHLLPLIWNCCVVVFL